MNQIDKNYEAFVKVYQSDLNYIVGRSDKDSPRTIMLSQMKPIDKYEWMQRELQWAIENQNEDYYDQLRECLGTDGPIH